MGLIDSLKDRMASKGPVEDSSSAGRAQRSGKKIRNPPEHGGPQQRSQGTQQSRTQQGQSQNWRQDSQGSQGMQNQGNDEWGQGPQDQGQRQGQDMGPSGPGSDFGPEPGMDDRDRGMDMGQQPQGAGPQDEFNPPNRFDEPMDETGQFGQDELGQDDWSQGPSGTNDMGPGGPGQGPADDLGGPGPQNDNDWDSNAAPNFERGQSNSPARGPGMASQNRQDSQGGQSRMDRSPQEPPRPPRGGTEEPPSPNHYNLDLPDEEGAVEGEVHTELRQIMRQNERIIDLLEQIKRNR